MISTGSPKRIIAGASLRAMSHRTQFVAIAWGQLAGRHSLRDIILNMLPMSPVYSVTYGPSVDPGSLPLRERSGTLTSVSLYLCGSQTLGRCLADA